MDNRILLESIGEIEDEYIVSAQNAIHKYKNGIMSEKKTFAKHSCRKPFAVLAAAIIMLLASVTVAMAASEDFRDMVFAFFHIAVPENVPNIEDHENPPMTAAIGERIRAYYIPIETYSHADIVNDIVIIKNDAGQKEYTVGGKKINEVSTNITSVQFEHGDRQIMGIIEWCLSEGGVTVVGKEYKEENTVEWDVIPINGNTSKAQVFLYLGEAPVRDVYSLILDVNTGIITDPLSIVDLSQVTRIEDIYYSIDVSSALVWGTTIGEARVKPYICDIATGKLSDVCELTGTDISNAYFIDNTTVLISQYSENDTMSYWTYDTATASLTQTLKDIVCENPISGVHGLCDLGGKYALDVGENGNVRIIELTTGYYSASIDGFVYDADTVFVGNYDSSKALFYKTDPAVEGMGICELGVIDFQTEEFITFDRENYSKNYEWSIGWLGKDKVCVFIGGNGACLYIYEFGPGSIGSK